jgi:hypothetical protein
METAKEREARLDREHVQSCPICRELDRLHRQPPKPPQIPAGRFPRGGQLPLKLRPGGGRR